MCYLGLKTNINLSFVFEGMAQRGQTSTGWFYGFKLHLVINISQIKHSRHRSQFGFLLEVAAGLIAYTFQPKKPSLNLRDNEIAIFKRS
ncbi:hypothetical protein TCT1_24850 [Xenorhabdus sp. TCT-1]|uniref:Transposase DDE domain-containing protein n=1 Tax=Xenorhabdus taiwanensis TaxID=3085177 RepID=A0ABM8JXZ1_9GAMM|nr:hypothetical protein TCT1_24850 [Xenorhabdus sp. TCT-1]